VLAGGLSGLHEGGQAGHGGGGSGLGRTSSGPPGGDSFQDFPAYKTPEIVKMKK
jgi:hypothetical protein